MLDDGKNNNHRILTGLGFIFWKPVSSVHISNIHYPTFDSLTKVKSPTIIAEHKYCNAASINVTGSGETISKEVSVGEDSTFSSSFHLEIGESITVSGGVPMLEKAEATVSWKLSADISFSKTTHKADTEKHELVFPQTTIPPQTSLTYHFSQWKGEVNNLPYTATIDVNFNDGTKWSLDDTGTYSGASYLSMDEWWSPNQHVTSCGDVVNVTASSAQVLV